MNHLNEDELVLHYYGDLDAAAKTRASLHIGECKECAAEFARLEQVLAAVNDQTMPVPMRGESYGARVWANIADGLQEKKPSLWNLWFAPQRLAFGGACVTVLIAVFILGRISKPGNEFTGATPPTVEYRNQVILFAVGQHLEKSQIVLMELTNADTTNGTLDISHEQEQARTLLTANRLYRQSAQKVSQPVVPEVLDELERVLVQVANSPSKLNNTELARIQKSIEAQGLLFKVRVVESNVKSSTANNNPKLRAEQQPRGRI